MLVGMQRQRVHREIPFPGCFLVGAPRCGTTAMSYYLRLHPQVCFSDPKEPHFFSHLWRQRPPRDLRSEYLERYFGAYDPRCHRILCDGSISYLYDRAALERILELDPAARFLVMVRDPCEMLPSYHQRLVYVLQEDVTCFEKAWQLQERRERGEMLPPGCIDPQALRYADVARFGARLSELFELAGRESCHVIVYDDLRSDPRAVYLGVLDFFGLEDDARQEFPRRARSKVYREPPGAIARRTVPWILSMRGRRGLPAGLLRWLKRRLRRSKIEAPPPALTPELRRVVRRELASDVELLESLLARDLGHWLGGQRDQAGALHAPASGGPLQPTPASNLREIATARDGTTPPGPARAPDEDAASTPERVAG